MHQRKKVKKKIDKGFSICRRDIHQSQKNIFSLLVNQPESDYIYYIPIDLEPNGKKNSYKKMYWFI